MTLPGLNHSMINSIYPSPIRLLSSIQSSSTPYENYIYDDEINAISQFARRVLKPGGGSSHLVSFTNFHKFFTELLRIVFFVPEYPIVVMKDTSNVHQHRGDHPHNDCGCAITGRAPGTHPDGFKADLRSPYNCIPSKKTDGIPQSRMFLFPRIN